MGRYDPPDSRSLPIEKRTIALYGEGDDKGKYYRCWNCGMICNSDRDEIGTGTGVEITEAVESAYNVRGQGTAAVTLIVSGPNRLWAYNLDGTLQTVVHNHIPDVTAGCPFCGTKNYR